MKKTLLVFALCMVALVFAFKAPVSAEVINNSSLTFFAFGDSIAEGTVMTQSGNDGNESLVLDDDGSYFTSNRYNNKLSAEISASVDNVNYQNYAHSGDKLADFITVAEGISNLEEADIVTLCIGANDILGPGLDAIPSEITADVVLDLLEGASSLDENVLSNTISTNLTNRITSAMAEGAQAFSASYETELRSFLASLSPDANVYIMTVYNPYKDVTVKFNVTYTMYLTLTITVTLDLDEITEPYLNTNTDSVNETIRSAVESIQNDSSVSQNVELIEVYGAFEGVYQSGGISEYKELVLVKDQARDSETTPLNASDLGSLDYLLDPHPDDAGHDLIAQTFWAQMQGESSAEELSVSLAQGSSSSSLASQNSFTYDSQATYTFSLNQNADWVLSLSSGSQVASSSSSTQLVVPASQLGVGSYNLAVRPNSSAVEYAYFLTFTEPVVEPEPEPTELVVTRGDSALEDGTTLGSIIVGNSISLSTNQNVFVKVQNELGDEVFSNWTTVGSQGYDITFTPTLAGSYTLQMFEDEISTDALFSITISVIDEQEPPVETKPNPSNLYLRLFSSAQNGEYSDYEQIEPADYDYEITYASGTSYILKLWGEVGGESRAILRSDYDAGQSISFYYVRSGNDLKYIKLDTLTINADGSASWESGSSLSTTEIYLPISGNLLNVGTYRFFAVLEGVGTSYNICEIRLNPPETLRISSIEMQEERGAPGELSAYTFAVILQDSYGLDPEIVWEIDGEVVGYGSRLESYVPTEQGAHRVTAKLVINGVVSENSAYSTSFNATQNNTIVIIIGCGVFVLLLIIALVVTIVVKIRRERIW